VVKEIHPCTVPEIIPLPIIGGNEDYLKRAEKETRKKLLPSLKWLNVG
jgi:uncharacterized protein involved in tolerance to divalent cations